MTDRGEERAGASPARPRWTAGRVVGMVFASIGGLIGLALVAAGIAVIAAYAFDRDDDGYFNTDRKQLRTPTYAITTGKIDLGADEVDWAPDAVLGNIRLQVEAAGKPVFVGIGPDDDVNRYLGDVSHAELTDIDGGQPQFDPHRGRAPQRPPGRQSFWVAQAQGSGEQAVTWDAEFGRWTAVVMNADAARGVDVRADAGIKLGWAIWAGIGMVVIGLLITAGAAVLILRLGRNRPSTAGSLGE